LIKLQTHEYFSRFCIQFGNIDNLVGEIIARRPAEKKTPAKTAFSMVSASICPDILSEIERLIFVRLP
jgi:hypothetical protein